jgi:hypothetical protein
MLIPVITFAQNQDKVRISPKAMVQQTVGFTDVSIEYSRPGVKERKIWGGLVPYHVVWRAGANEATKISFSTDVEINGKKLRAGSYSFFTVPTRIEVTPEEGYWQEWLVYTVTKTSDNSAIIKLEWENLKVPFTVEVEIE